MAWGLVIGLIVVAAGAFVFLKMRGTAEEEVYYQKCPNCRQRLKYRVSQVGHKGLCPRCRMQFDFPPPKKQ